MGGREAVHWNLLERPVVTIRCATQKNKKGWKFKKNNVQGSSHEN